MKVAISNRFPKADAEALLAACHRRCCVCHRFCGVKMELDHMQPVAVGGGSDIGNAIPLCFECHAEVHAYNDKHPRGRKFTPSELRTHKEQWLAICRENPAALLQSSWDADVGPLQALVDELDFNIGVAERATPNAIGSLLLDEQFRRALQFGAISILRDEIRQALIAAYVEVGRTNQLLLGMQPHKPGTDAYNTRLNDAQKALRAMLELLRHAREQVMSFVKRDDAGAEDKQSAASGSVALVVGRRGEKRPRRLQGGFESWGPWADGPIESCTLTGDFGVGPCVLVVAWKEEGDRWEMKATATDGVHFKGTMMAKGYETTAVSVTLWNAPHGSGWLLEGVYSSEGGPGAWVMRLAEDDDDV